MRTPLLCAFPAIAHCLLNMTVLKHIQPTILVRPGPSTRACDTAGVELTKQCMSKFIAMYGYSLTENGTLPSAWSPLFDKVMIDVNNICKHFDALMACLGTEYKNCLTIKTLAQFSASVDDATYYAQELALFELYCTNSKLFIEYFECSQTIMDDDLNEAVLEHCDEQQHNPDCADMVVVSKCQLVVFKKDCGKNIQKAFCAYNNIRMRMYGYEQCEDQPCFSERPFSALFSAATCILVLIFYFFDES